MVGWGTAAWAILNPPPAQSPSLRGWFGGGCDGGGGNDGGGDGGGDGLVVVVCCYSSSWCCCGGDGGEGGVVVLVVVMMVVVLMVVMIEKMRWMWKGSGGKGYEVCFNVWTKICETCNTNKYTFNQKFLLKNSIILSGLNFFHFSFFLNFLYFSIFFFLTTNFFHLIFFFKTSFL